MSMAIDKKKVAALIVARMKPAGDMNAMKKSNADAFGERAAEPEKSDDQGLMSAGDEIMQALESKDLQGFVRALTDFVEMSQGAAEEAPEAPAAE